MKKRFSPLAAASGCILVVALASCSSSHNNEGFDRVNVHRLSSEVDVAAMDIPGFNVEEFSKLLKTTRDAEKLEEAINASGNKVNNLDLDEDGKIDYLTVSEAQNKMQILDDAKGQPETIAELTITATEDGKSGTMDIHSSPTYAGAHHSYHSGFSLADFMLLSYLMRPHVFYHSPYHYGYYPHAYNSAPRTVQRTVTRRSSPTHSSSYSRSDNQSSRKSLSTPSSSQRSFSSTTDRPSSFSGFGSSSRSSRSTFSSGSSRSSFGSGRSSFGRSGFGRRR